jgi:hypothetical protein
MIVDAEARAYGVAFTARLAERMAEIQPMHWPPLDRALIDWWYSDVIELPRWEGEGGR